MRITNAHDSSMEGSVHEGQRMFDFMNLSPIDESELTSVRQTSGRVLSKVILPTEAQYVKSNVIIGRKSIVPRAPTGPPNS
jgi:hypothetical protein